MTWQKLDNLNFHKGVSLVNAPMAASSQQTAPSHHISQIREDWKLTEICPVDDVSLSRM